MSENSPEQFIPDLDTSAIWTVRFVDPSGFEVQLSIEAPSGTEAMRKGQLVIERLKEIQCSPVVRNNPNPMAKVQDQDNQLTCPIHHTPMRLFQKNGRSWHAHKTESGIWCKGEKK